MRKLFGHIWALWTGFLYAILLVIYGIIAFFSFSLGNEKIKRKAHWLPNHAAKVLLFLSGMKCKLLGQPINKNGQYIYVANHVNLLDVVYVRSIISTYLKILAKQEILKMPIMGYFAKTMGILINRGDKKDRERGINDMNEQLQKTGASILIYPEGTRNTTKEWLLPFKNGAFITAIENQIPIACITLKGIRDRMPPNKFTVFPGSLNAYIDIFETKGMVKEDFEKLKETVRAKMLTYFVGQPLTA